jgi:hypothetical protein
VAHRAQYADDNLKRGQTSRLRASLLPNIYFLHQRSTTPQIRYSDDSSPTTELDYNIQSSESQIQSQDRQHQPPALRDHLAASL